MAETVVETPPKKPAKAPKKDAVPKAITFFERMASIARADWGTRARVKIYRLEPIVDNLRVSDNKYIKIFNEPVTEETLKRDPSCGSGKYRLYLNYKAPTENEKEIDSVELEILDNAFPPKIARGTWVDDPRNEKWAWAKKHFPEEKAPGTDAESLLIKGVELADRLATRNGTSTTVSNPVQDAAGIVDMAEKFAARLAPPPQTENKTLDSIVQLIIAQNQAAEIRTRAAEDRNTMLLSLLLKDRDKPAERNGSSMKEVVAMIKDDIIPLAEKILPGAKDAMSGIAGRSKMSGWQEMLQPALPVVVDFLKPFAGAIAQGLLTRMTQPTAPQPIQPMQNGAARPQPAAATLPQPEQNGALPPLLNLIAPAMLNYMRVEADPVELGDDFASWVHEGFSADPRFTSAFAMARAAGPNGIVVAFKGSPWWLDKGPNRDLASLQEMEGKFAMFAQALLEWKPEKPEAEADYADGPEVISIGHIG